MQKVRTKTTIYPLLGHRNEFGKNKKTDRFRVSTYGSKKGPPLICSQPAPIIHNNIIIINIINQKADPLQHKNLILGHQTHALFKYHHIPIISY